MAHIQKVKAWLIHSLNQSLTHASFFVILVQLVRQEGRIVCARLPVNDLFLQG